MNKHFVKITQTYATKNKLQAAIYEALKGHDGTLLEKKFKDTFISEVKEKVSDLCNQFPRCTNEHISVFNHDDFDTGFIIGNVMILSIYQVKVSA